MTVSASQTHTASNSGWEKTTEGGKLCFKQKDDNDASTDEIKFIEETPGNFVFVNESKHTKGMTFTKAEANEYIINHSPTNSEIDWHGETPLKAPVVAEKTQTGKAPVVVEKTQTVEDKKKTEEKTPPEDEPMTSQEQFEFNQMTEERSGESNRYTHCTTAVTPATFAGGDTKFICNGKAMITPDGHYISNKDGALWKQAKEARHTWDVANAPTSFGMKGPGDWSERNKTFVTDRGSKIPGIADRKNDIYSSPDLEKAGVICYYGDDGKRHVAMKDYPVGNPAYAQLLAWYKENHPETK